MSSLDPRNTVFIILHETWLASILKDIGSIGTLVALIYVNHVYGAGHGVIDITGLTLLWVHFFTGPKDKVVKLTTAQLRDWAINRTNEDIRQTGQTDFL